MELVIRRKFKGERLMPCGPGTVIPGGKRYEFLSGNTATTDNYDPPIRMEARRTISRQSAGIAACSLKEGRLGLALQSFSRSQESLRGRSKIG